MFRLFFIDADVATWTDWAMGIVNEETGETRVHQDIVEFIANNPDALNMPESDDDICPSSRSWERLSHTYKAFKTLKGFTQADLYHICRGDLGNTVALQFTQFLKDNANPIIKPEEIFIVESTTKEGRKTVKKYKELSEEQIKRIVGDRSYPRMMMIVKNCVRYVLQSKKDEGMAERLIDVIVLLPKDLMVMVMQTILSEHKELFNVLGQYEKFVDAFHNVDQLIR